MSLSPGKEKYSLQGFAAALPIWIGYVAVGIPFGVLARQAGLTPVDIALMSLVVFAGSSQFIAVSMMAAGTSAVPVIVTTFIVNLRHLLMSSALALHVKDAGKPLLSLFAYGVTDESFAVNHTHFSRGSWKMRDALIVNQSANLVWICSTVMGGYLGNLVPDGAFGLDFVLTAMFIGLLMYQLKGGLVLMAAIISGVLAIVFFLVIPGAWYVVISSMVASTICAFMSGKTGSIEAEHDAP